jgi:hypothetical protein
MKSSILRTHLLPTVLVATGILAIVLASQAFAQVSHECVNGTFAPAVEPGLCGCSHICSSNSDMQLADCKNKTTTGTCIDATCTGAVGPCNRVSSSCRTQATRDCGEPSSKCRRSSSSYPNCTAQACPDNGVTSVYQSVLVCN